MLKSEVLTLDLCERECVEETDRTSVSVIVYRSDMKKDIGETGSVSSIALWICPADILKMKFEGVSEGWLLTRYAHVPTLRNTNPGFSTLIHYVWPGRQQDTYLPILQHELHSQLHHQFSWRSKLPSKLRASLKNTHSRPHTQGTEWRRRPRCGDISPV